MSKKEFVYDVFIKGKYIDLVVLNETIVKNTNWHKWFNDEETTTHMQKHYYPNTLEKQMSFYNQLKDDTSTLQLGIVEKEKIFFCGTVSLSNINFFNRNAEVSLIIGEKRCRNLHIASEALSLIIDHGFNTLNLHKINAGYLKSLEDWGVFLQNTFGFEKEGVQKEQVFKDGKFIDVINIGLIKKNLK